MALVLCFDGCDNLGKSTVIDYIKNELKTNYNVFIIPSTAPPKNVDEKTFELYQTKIFTERSEMINNILSYKNSKLDTIILLDRFCYDEGVYGKIYRSATDEYVKNLCKVCYNKIKGNLTTVKLGVIQLTASSDFIIKHDDGKSFTSSMDYNKCLDKVKLEQSLFNDCLSDALENNSLDFYFNIQVENIEKSTYRDVKNIYSEIIETLSILYPIKYKK